MLKQKELIKRKKIQKKHKKEEKKLATAKYLKINHDKSLHR